MVFRRKKDDKEDPFDDVFRRPFDADPFEDFFGNFRRMNEMVNELMRNMFRGADIRSGKPFVYGFSIKTGPDGKPVIREFGNVKPGQMPMVSDAREPLVDVIEGEKDITVIVELPGVEKKDINLEVVGGALEIKVDTPQKKYYKSVQLPDEVIEDTANATYNNGVLEVKLRRKTVKKERGKRIKIK